MVSMRLLGRTVALRLELRELRPNELVVYTSTQPGLPAARHERHFVDVGGRLEYGLVAEYEPCGGLRGLYDRLIVPRAVRRAMRQTLARLEEVFAATRQGA